MERDTHVFRYRFGKDSETEDLVWKHAVNHNGKHKRYIVHPNSPLKPQSSDQLFKGIEGKPRSVSSDRKHVSIWISLVEEVLPPASEKTPQIDPVHERSSRARQGAEAFHQHRRGIF